MGVYGRLCGGIRDTFISGTEHRKEDNQDLYYSAEIAGQQTQTFNV